MRNRALLFAAPLAAATLLLSGCVANATAGGDGSSLTVTSTADDCAVSSNTVASGTISFAVSNSTDQVSEFYLLAEDGLRIVGEVENVGPGVSRTLVVRAQPGNYFTVWKPILV